MQSNRNPRRLLAALMIATAGVAPALLLAPDAALAQLALRFDLPAQPLSAAVSGFGRVSGWQVAYPAELGGLRTRAVSGEMPPAQALSAMLAGTDIQLRQTGPDSAALSRAPAAASAGAAPAGAVQLYQITLTGESASGPFPGIIAQRSASGTKTDTPLIETPQTVNVIGREQMEQQGGTTVTDALRYTPGVVAGTNGGQSGRFDTYFVRGSGGFSAAANNANTMDGLRWRIPGRSGVQFDPWMVERVEVVKGPSSTLFGSGSPGGIVNLVSKRPEFQRHGEVFTAIGTHDRVETGIDYTGPLSDTLAYRVIGLARQGKTGIDFQRDERVLLAPSLTWAPTDATTVTLQALYQRDPHSPDAQFVPAYGSVLPIPGFGTVDPDFWQGDPNYQEFSRTQTALGWQIDHDFNDNWSLHSGFRWGKMHTQSKSMDFYTASGTTIYRYAFLAEHATESTSTDNYVQGKFQTGAASHTLIAGVDYQKLSGRWESGADYNTGFSFYPIDMADPAYGISITEPVLSGRIRQPFEQIGAYVQDQVALGSWPRLDPRGRFLPGHARIRKYTIRALDVAAGWMDIDFVIHHPAGPGSDWAAQARVGDRLGLIGPGGGGIRPAGAEPEAPLLLLGDETALPAIARALETLPPGQTATAFIEIAGNAERQHLALPPDARLTWLPRDGRPHGQALVQALQDSAPDPDTLVWAGCEFAAFRAMRHHLRGPLDHPRARHLITAYWRQGIAAPDRG